MVVGRLHAFPSLWEMTLPFRVAALLQYLCLLPVPLSAPSKVQLLPSPQYPWCGLLLSVCRALIYGGLEYFVMCSQAFWISFPVNFFFPHLLLGCSSSWLACTGFGFLPEPVHNRRMTSVLHAPGLLSAVFTGTVSHKCQWWCGGFCSWIWLRGHVNSAACCQLPDIMSWRSHNLKTEGTQLCEIRPSPLFVSIFTDENLSGVDNWGGVGMSWFGLCWTSWRLENFWSWHFICLFTQTDPMESSTFSYGSYL